MEFRNNEARYIRFDGILQENMQFELRAGWETTRIFRRSDKGEGEYILELLDEERQTLTRVYPEVDFSVGCLTDENDSMAATRVVDYIPYHPDARLLVFRREDMVIFEAPVAKEPPTIELNAVKTLKKDTLHLEWSVKTSGERKLTYNIIYILNGERFFPVARDLKKTEVMVDLSNIPGGQSAQIAVLATDGIRSSFVVSEPFETEERPPQVWIQQPEDGATLPPDQPVSLIGQALDVAGASLPDSGLVWEVDGKTIAESTRVAMVNNLEPGKHVITLSYSEGKKVHISQSITIAIDERNEAQERFRQMMTR